MIVGLYIDVAMAMLAAFLAGGAVGVVVGVWWRVETRSRAGGAS